MSNSYNPIPILLTYCKLLSSNIILAIIYQNIPLSNMSKQLKIQIFPKDSDGSGFHSLLSSFC